MGLRGVWARVSGCDVIATEWWSPSGADANDRAARRLLLRAVALDHRLQMGAAAPTLPDGVEASVEMHVREARHLGYRAAPGSDELYGDAIPILVAWARCQLQRGRLF